MTVEVLQVARIEEWPGVPAPVLVGWEHRAGCGCALLEGMRMDRPGPGDLVYEPVVAFTFCGADGHQAALEALRDDIFGEPPTDVPLHPLLTERFAAVAGAWS